MVSCSQCGLKHGPGELFVAHGDDPLHPLVETCELERAMREAHAAPLPASSVAYHATPPDGSRRGRIENPQHSIRLEPVAVMARLAKFEEQIEPGHVDLEDVEYDPRRERRSSDDFHRPSGDLGCRREADVLAG